MKLPEKKNKFWKSKSTFLKSKNLKEDFPEGTIVLSSRSGERLTRPFLLTEAFPWTPEAWCFRHTSQLWIHGIKSLYCRVLQSLLQRNLKKRSSETQFPQLSLRLSAYLQDINVGRGQEWCWKVCKASTVLGTSVICPNTDKGTRQT